MKITNVKIVTPYKEFTGTIEVESGKIKRVYEGKDRGEDMEGLIAVPGFVDVHTHGIGGYDFTSWRSVDEFLGNLLKMREIYVKYGVTTFLPTTVTLPKEDLAEACKAVGEIEDPSIAGLHLEGPFISEKHAGAQDVRYIRSPDMTEVRRCVELSKNKLRTVTVAPEKGLEFVSALVGMGIHVSIGHTDADYETATKAFLLGADRTTHIFNAMRPFHHRDPGVILASINYSPYIEIIPDFIHVDKELVKFLVKSVGRERVVGVTDSIMAAGLSDGEYTLGKVEITVKEGRALTKEGKLAGSTLTMDKAFANLAKLTGLYDAVMMTSYNPAKALGLTDRGALLPGKNADIVLLDDKLRVVKVYKNGEEIG
ncbi:N-acetylglucosamine-6-phosphate deacetylase [Stygiolobus caldivivus]|uniref:N-acetylglucosamine-6-phosphate deacetylase n=1 Tax=Stygiolobus caldivivus TaxID=2824673 RepID=A0A8D5U5N8_9CREN|nr:N-acetylglucosamine-6-phosphate deacetylase [Stygiolobus caldivivus]BCU69956.1 N-acetylglucosamine-6-phosphate deacetylase [Stygiolobus caldivivus]